MNTAWSPPEKNIILKQLDTLEEHALFSNAPRQILFLRYIVETALNGEAAELNQTRIAIDALGRDADYDPSIDSTVRVEAGRLRAKLRDYYAGEGASDPVQISLPKGRYSPAITVAEKETSVAQRQKICFLKTEDETTIAYAESGNGIPLVKAANWLSHLEYDFVSPVWKHWWTDLSKEHRLIRYDERGCGLSDWDVSDFSMNAWVEDLEQVVDHLGTDRFALLGISQGASVAIEYAVRHPERVSHLILYGGFIQGRLKREISPEKREEAMLLQRLIRVGWGQNNPAFRKTFATLFMPDATTEHMEAFDALQRASTSAENAERFLEAFNNIDVLKTAAQVRVPTLVLHSRNEQEVPFEQARQIASTIPNASLAPLESNNHVLCEAEPAWEVFLEEISRFVQSES